MPIRTHLASWRLVRRSSGSTLSHPCIDRPRISMRRAPVVATSVSDCAGSTRTNTPPWPLAATAMLPPIKNASPPNIFFSVKPDSPASNSRMRPASSSSYATAAIVRQDDDEPTALSVRIRGSFGGRDRAVMSADDGGSRTHPRRYGFSRQPRASSAISAANATSVTSAVTTSESSGRGSTTARSRAASPEASSARRPLRSRPSCSLRSWPTRNRRRSLRLSPPTQPPSSRDGRTSSGCGTSGWRLRGGRRRTPRGRFRPRGAPGP